MLSIHDISDGGLATCLIEMAIGGMAGIDVDIPQAEGEVTESVPVALREAFNEEIG